MDKEDRRDNGFEVIVIPPKRVVSIKLEVDIIEEIDKVWRKLGYSSRSEFIRDAILCYLQLADRMHGRTLRPEDLLDMDADAGMGLEDDEDEL